MGDLAEMRFIRAGRIARNLDLSPDQARRQVRRGLYGTPRFMHGEWCAPLDGYEAFVKGAAVAPEVSAERTAGLRRGVRKPGNSHLALAVLHQRAG